MTLTALFLHCAVRLRYMCHSETFLAFRHMEVENMKKAKIKREMDQGNWLKHKSLLML